MNKIGNCMPTVPQRGVHKHISSLCLRMKRFEKDNEFHTAVGSTEWILNALGNDPILRQERLWEVFWHTQTKLQLGVITCLQSQYKPVTKRE